MTKPLPLPLKELLRRIEAKTEKTASCWLWTGPMSAKIPRLNFRHEGKLIGLSVRRVIWLSLFGPPGSSISIETTCHVDACIRDIHLVEFTGTDRMRRAHRVQHDGGFKPLYDDSVVQESVRLFDGGMTQQKISLVLGVPQGTIARWMRGDQRRSTSGFAKIPGGFWIKHRHAKGQKASHPRKLTYEKVLHICHLRLMGVRQFEIAEIVGCGRTFVSRVCSGEKWKWLTGDLTPIRLKKNIPVVTTEPADESHPDEALVWEHWKGGKAS